MFRKRPAGRPAGFTLIELLVVITIIGILAGLLAVAIGPILIRSDDFKTENDLQQLDAAIEVFKNKFGFYPPDFATFQGNPDEMLPYLNRISPTHQETFPDPVVNDGTTRRLDVWWNQVGIPILAAGHETSLWFWLSQLYNNAQYPLTSRRDPNDATRLLDTRHAFFDFEAGRLHDLYPGNSIYYPDPNNASPTNPSGTPNTVQVFHYEQAGSGKCPYIYIHHESYGLPAFPPTECRDADNPNDPQYWIAPYVDPATGWYYNATSYQIIAAGNDHGYGTCEPNPPPPFTPNTYKDPRFRSERDNLANFSSGRIETMEAIQP